MISLRSECGQKFAQQHWKHLGNCCCEGPEGFERRSKSVHPSLPGSLLWLLLRIFDINGLDRITFPKQPSAGQCDLSGQADETILNALKESAAGCKEANSAKKGHVIVFYDQQLGGETSAQPHLRTPPLRARGQHLARLVGIALKRRDCEEIYPGDLYVLNDAGKAGNKSVLMSAFVKTDGSAMKRCTNALTLFLSEESLSGRLAQFKGSQCRGATNLNSKQEVKAMQTGDACSAQTEELAANTFHHVLSELESLAMQNHWRLRCCVSFGSLGVGSEGPNSFVI